MEYDVIVIGGGTAGLAAYRKAKSLDKKTLIIEKNDFATTCANVGCMPSKLLIAAAENMHELERSKEFGIEIGKVKINQNVLWKRVQSERDRFVGFVKAGADKIVSEDKLIGYANIKDMHTVEVNGISYTTKTIVLATGSHPFVPSIFEEFKNEILTNENIFELNEVPTSIAVFGVGVIGLELGFALHHLGSKVTMFNKTNSVLKLNEETNNYLLNHIKDNMSFITENVTKIEKKNNGYQIDYLNESIWVEKILIAAGRKPNINKNMLEALGIEDGNISKLLNLYNNKTTQVGNLPLFLAGDVNNEVTLLHEAAKEGNIAGYNAAHYPEIKEHKRNVFLGITFSSPQIMQVGETNFDIERQKNIIEGKVSFEDQGRSRVMLKNKGLMSIYFDKKTNRLLGAEMIGPDAEHIGHLLAWVIEKDITIEELLELPFYHPVVEEGLRTAIRDAYAKFQ